MNIEKGSLCIEGNGSFFYITSFPETLYGVHHHLFVGNKITFDYNQKVPYIMYLKEVTVWKCICTDHAIY